MGKTELDNAIWAEKYRPDTFDDLIFEKKDQLQSFLKNPKQMPSFIFYSSKPGTGKTSTAKIIIDVLKCDALRINSSDERGIDTIRDKIRLFACSMSSNPDTKRCVFLDEADGLTRIAQDSLRNLMETYSDNCFFVFSCNDVGKIIEPIRSRCVSLDFEKPNRLDITARLLNIVDVEKLDVSAQSLQELIDLHYPDIRSMIVKLQQHNIDKSFPLIDKKGYESFLDLVKKHDVDSIYKKVYSGTFNILEFNKYFFRHLYDNYDKYGFEKTKLISICLADTERSWNVGANLEIIFLSNVMRIMTVL